MEARPVFYGDMVRLHVLADSDKPRAQREKLWAVGAVREASARVCAGARDASEAYRALTGAKGQIARAARKTLVRRGRLRRVRVETGVFAFPERRYGDVLVPAGDYRAVRVKIGRGAGRNWWCVIYPELCAVGELCARALAGEGEITFYSGLAKWIAGWFGGAS